MRNTPLDMTRLSAMDTSEAARLLQGMRDATLAGERPRVEPRADIGESWERMLRRGIDPDHDRRAGLLSLAEIEERRRVSPLGELLPVLREGLVEIADAVQHIMVVADTDGRVLWREGHPAVLRKADAHGFALGADWSESVVGTNGIGTPLVAGRPVQVHSAEHFVATHHTWTCAGSPVTDPRDGRVIGVVDVSGPPTTMHPATLSMVRSVTRLAEAELRNQHFAELERLRTVAAPVLARLSGRALAVDARGWSAAVTGMPPVGRLALPKTLGAGRVWLPTLGGCEVEPLPGGWLLRPEEPGAPARAPHRVTLDLRRSSGATVTVTGSTGSWTQDLTPRHAELLYVLASHPGGRTAAQLAQQLFGDPTRTVTVRAEMSRLRRNFTGVLTHRPYRFLDGVEVEVIGDFGV